MLDCSAQLAQAFQLTKMFYQNDRFAYCNSLMYAANFYHFDNK